ncbi:MAG: hypothetical protein HQL58_12095 [Magnetococcales bacterium]|nr:hypothetical protein [Magnetococcales bacterium]
MTNTINNIISEMAHHWAHNADIEQTFINAATEDRLLPYQLENEAIKAWNQQAKGFRMALMAAMVAALKAKLADDNKIKTSNR